MEFRRVLFRSVPAVSDGAARPVVRGTSEAEPGSDLLLGLGLRPRRTEGVARCPCTQLDGRSRSSLAGGGKGWRPGDAGNGCGGCGWRVLPCGHQHLARPRRTWSHRPRTRSEEHTSELQSLMRSSYAVFCLKKKNSSIPVLCTYYPLPPPLVSIQLYFT